MQLLVCANDMVLFNHKPSELQHRPAWVLPGLDKFANGANTETSLECDVSVAVSSWAVMRCHV